MLQYISMHVKEIDHWWLYCFWSTGTFLRTHKEEKEKNPNIANNWQQASIFWHFDKSNLLFCYILVLHFNDGLSNKWKFCVLP